MKILFIHGIEGDHNGTKARFIKEHFPNSLTVGMDSGYLNIFRSNSFLRSAFKSPFFWIWIIILIFTFQTDFTYLILNILISIIMGKMIIKDAIIRSYFNCLKIQEEAIMDFDPDLVVASSWGEAIAVGLILNGRWKGPTLLLAPAFHMVDKFSNILTHYDLESIEYSGKTMIVHSHKDKIIQIEHSCSLECLFNDISCEKVEFIQLEDSGGHRLLEITNDNRLKDYILSFKDN